MNKIKKTLLNCVTVLSVPNYIEKSSYGTYEDSEYIISWKKKIIIQINTNSYNIEIISKNEKNKYIFVLHWNPEKNYIFITHYAPWNLHDNQGEWYNDISNILHIKNDDIKNNVKKIFRKFPIYYDEYIKNEINNYLLPDISNIVMKYL